MPIIQFSSKDLLRNKVVQPAWYRVRIDAVGEAPSKDGGSINYLTEGTILKNADSNSEDNTGVPLEWNFNSKALGFAIPFLQAMDPTLTIDPTVRYDLNIAVGKELEIFVENGQWQGRIKNEVNHKYRPLRG